MTLPINPMVTPVHAPIRIEKIPSILYIIFTRMTMSLNGLRSILWE